MSESVEQRAPGLRVARNEFPHFGVEQIVEEQAPISIFLFFIVYDRIVLTRENLFASIRPCLEHDTCWMP